MAHFADGLRAIGLKLDAVSAQLGDLNARLVRVETQLEAHRASSEARHAEISRHVDRHLAAHAQAIATLESRVDTLEDARADAAAERRTILNVAGLARDLPWGWIVAATVAVSAWWQSLSHTLETRP